MKQRQKLLAVLFLLASLCGMAQPERPKVAVVLCGGGAKGAAHVGALKVIEEAGIPIDIVCGTSMGALIGGLYSIGWTPEEMDSVLRSQEWTTLLTDRVDPATLNIDKKRLQNTYALWHAISTKEEGGGIVRGINLDRLFNQLLYGYLDSIDFYSLPIPFACVATNLIDNAEIDFHHGYLKQAMRSSMSIPGVFAPVRMGDMLLVDGGLRNNYPADIAREMGADIVIGVTLQGDELTADDITHTVTVLEQIVDINCRNKYQYNVNHTDLLLNVDITGYSAASFTDDAIATLIARGEKVARDNWEALLDLRRRNGIDSTARPATLRRPTPPEEKHRVLEASPLLGERMVGAAFRFDNEENGALRVGAMLPYHWMVPMEASAYFRLGKRSQFHIENTIFPSGITSPAVAYSTFHDDMDYYVSGRRMINVRYNRHSLDLYPINSRFRRYELRAGLRWDYYHYDDHTLIRRGIDIGDFTNAHYFSLNVQTQHNSENHWYFPSSGTRIALRYAYITDNLLTYNGDQGMHDISAHWRINLPLASRLTLQPMAYGRLFIGQEQPLPFATLLGSEWFGNVSEMQMPFDGVTDNEYVDRNLMALRLQLQYRLFKNHYLHARFTMASSFAHLENFEKPEDLVNLFGGALAYFYNSFFGPIGFNIGYSNLLDKPTFYLSLGHHF
ncbi:MAG: patatin-like phospholipase family protein [Bacteroidales bacterium]|nr:patatin-like phospholipase family protein [Bacteroidales bacterium]